MVPPYNEPGRRGYVDVTIVEFAAHSAYLDPLTGVGYLVTPHEDTDVEALADPLVEAAWSERLNDRAETVHLTLHRADRRRALAQLGDMGWSLLRDEDGEIEIAGRTSDGREVLCIYGPPEVGEPTLEALDRAIIALDGATDLQVGARHCDDPAD